MAVENKYVNADIVAGIKARAVDAHGAKLVTAIVTFEVAVADDDGSIFRILKNIPASAVLQSVEIFNDALSGSTDWDLGLYRNLERGGAVLAVDVFVNGVSLASARVHGAGFDGLTNLDIANANDTVFEHAGDTLDTRELGYDLALTANTVGAAAGTVTVKITYAEGA